MRRELADAIEEAWRDLALPPGPEAERPRARSRDGADDAVERITCGTRVGYAFAIDSAQLLDWPAPDWCRFREPELVEALAGVALRLGLAPVITWQRFGEPLLGPLRQPQQHVFQLWEPGGDHAGQPGIDVAQGAGVGEDGEDGED